LFIIVGVAAASYVAGGYKAGRSFQTLRDRYKHQQDILLHSEESRNCLLKFGGFLVSVGTLTAAALFVQADTPLSLLGQSTLKTAAFCSLVVNGLVVGNELLNIVSKAVKKEKITKLDIFQLITTVFFFTHSYISTRKALSLIDSLGKNNSMKSPVDLRVLISGIGFSTDASTSVGSLTLERVNITVMKNVAQKLTEITKSMLRGLTSKCKFELKYGKLLHQVWESLNEEMVEVIDNIFPAIGVKRLSELVTKSGRVFESREIRELAVILIGEMSSWLGCGDTEKSSQQRQTISDNSAVVGTDDGPKSVIDGENQTYKSCYNELPKIFKKTVDQQEFRNTEDYAKYMRFVCKFVKRLIQEKMSDYEKSWNTVKRFNPDANIEDFKKEYGISGNPINHFLQEVFNKFNSEEKDIFTLLQLTYEKQNSDPSAHEEETGKCFLDVGAVRFYPFYSMCGLASNGMPSEQQYREMAAKLIGRSADTESICMSETGDTAFIQVNDAKYVIMVKCWPEDGKVSGIAAVLHTPAE
jgi:hypothetical protein